MAFLQQEHHNSNSSLCRTLKSGKRKPPTKKTLEELLPCDKEKLLEFSEQHPEVLKKYKMDAPARFHGKLSNSELSEVLHIDLDPKFKGVKFMTTNINIQGDVIGGNIGGGTINARDISVFKKTIDASFTDQSIRKALLDSRTRIETAPISPADKADAADTLGQIATELQERQPDKRRLSSWLNLLGKIVPLAVTALKGIKIVADMASGS